jgi:hypothetical protein
MQTCGKGDGERMQKDNSSSSMKRPRPSETTNGRTTVLTFKAMEDHPTLEQALVSLQDGGNCLDSKVSSLLMKEERYSKSKEVLTMNKEIWLFQTRIMLSVKDSRLSTLMNIQVNQQRDR